jgi:hypothetical protein
VLNTDTERESAGVGLNTVRLRGRDTNSQITG